ncbi:helix-turn-helix transcriptional regulator [Caballeronia sp. INDeC2]|uniref:helix-turn-helix domain-containing protein n=1 Tax=Caballeronia sp. INDeC2 TaxID=2921747 RepID=UPI0020282E98|nr:helix-turn-helix transcriptional regulator [Caballeronia sp. INDeC2]
MSRLVEESFGGDMEAEICAVLGADIRAARARKGLNQDRMAELAHVHGNYLDRIEREERNISMESLCRLARALGCQPFELLQPDFTPTVQR